MSRVLIGSSWPLASRTSIDSARRDWRRRFCAAAALSLAALAASGPARAQAPGSLLDAVFPAGSDFCFGRAYAATHLAQNPKQTVTAIFVGGRNAQHTAGEPAPAGAFKATGGPGPVFVSLRVRFRDGSRIWSGTCREEEPGQIRCGILPHRNRDSIDQGLTLRQAGTGLVIEASGDWAYFRAALDRGGGDRVAPADRLFRVEPLPVSACQLSATYWAPKGATAKFLADFP